MLRHTIYLNTGKCKPLLERPLQLLSAPIYSVKMKHILDYFSSTSSKKAKPEDDKPVDKPVGTPTESPTTNYHIENKSMVVICKIFSVLNF